jgi:hypothetical protein
MELSELSTILAELNIPIAYNHFISRQTPPYLVYKVTSNNGFSADNKVYEKIRHINIELYTENKNEILEGQLETILCNHEMVFDSFESYIESENVYQVVYEITI